MAYGPNLKTSTKKRNTIILAISLVLLAVLFFGGWKYWQHRQLIKLEQTKNSQTELGNESKRDDTASNTNVQNQNLASSSASPSVSSNSSVNLPTPLLTKSSGNNGSVPAGVVIEFTCVSNSSYQCTIRLTGPKTINLETQTLSNNNRGENYGAIWDWTSVFGKWSVTAVLSDGKGNEKSSASQSLEVK